MHKCMSPHGDYDHMGGAITKGILGLTDVDVIQLEINGNYRDYNKLELLEKLIKSLEKFIKQYNESIRR